MLLWGTNCAQDFDLNIDLHSVDVDDVVPRTIMLSDTKRHASLWSSFLLKNFLFDVVNTIFFQKLVGNLNNMTFANFG